MDALCREMAAMAWQRWTDIFNQNWPSASGVNDGSRQMLAIPHGRSAEQEAAKAEYPEAISVLQTVLADIHRADQELNVLDGCGLVCMRGTSLQHLHP